MQFFTKDFELNVILLALDCSTDLLDYMMLIGFQPLYFFFLVECRILQLTNLLLQIAVLFSQIHLGKIKFHFHLFYFFLQHSISSL